MWTKSRRCIRFVYLVGLKGIRCVGDDVRGELGEVLRLKEG